MQVFVPAFASDNNKGDSPPKFKCEISRIIRGVCTTYHRAVLCVTTCDAPNGFSLLVIFVRGHTTGFVFCHVLHSLFKTAGHPVLLIFEM